MPENPNSHNNGTKRYPPELKERAVRMALETIEKTGERSGAVSRIARQLGIGDQSLRNWVAQAEIDRGAKAGLTTEERRRIVELERENKELRRANEMAPSRPQRCPVPAAWGHMVWVGP